MIAPPSLWSEAVAIALHDLRPDTAPAGATRWQVPADGTRPEFTAALDESWLVLRFNDRISQNGTDPFALAEENAGLPPMLKRNGSLLADIPLTEPRRLPAILSRLLSSLGPGDAFEAQAPANEDTKARPSDDSTPDLIHLCEQAGWPATRHKDISLTVELECRRGFYQADITETRGAIRLRAPLLDAEDNVRPGARAAARMLCAVADAVHLVRPYAEKADSAPALGLEVLLHAPAHQGELAAALAALSVAADTCGPELQLLGDDDFANAYLTFADNPGASAPTSKTTKESKNHDNAE